MKILIVDDEDVSLTSVRRILKWRGIRDVEVCDNGKDAIKRIKEGDFDIVLLDLLMPEVDGMQVLEFAKPFQPQTEFIILTAVDDIPTTVKAIRQGAYDYLVKPVDNELLFLSIDRAYERKGLLAGLSTTARCDVSDIPAAFSDTITSNQQMKALISYAQVMARSGNPIMITGESGTGKELMARGIHRAGPAPDGPFVAVNVSAIPTTMFESQFFGHTKGAFTGADNRYQGFFEQADGGTLFLDEIGELPIGVQSKLLRVLEDKTFTPLGASKPVSVDIRFISATNIPELAAHFLQNACIRYGKYIKGFSPEAMNILENKDYPGNIRELSQIVENAVILADNSIILPSHMGEITAPLSSPSGRKLCTLKENYDLHMAFVLNHTKGDRRDAARILGITVRQLQRKLAEMK